jgi:hypothetical protein
VETSPNFSTGECREERFHLALHLIRGFEGLCDLGFNAGPEAFAEAVHGHAKGFGFHLGSFGEGALFSVGKIAGEERFDSMEKGAVPFLFTLGLKALESASEDGDGPLAVELRFRGTLMGSGGVERLGLEGEPFLIAAAFEALGGLAMAGEEVFECTEEIGAEFSEGGVGGLEGGACENFGEEGVSEFPGFRWVGEMAA